MTYKLTATVTHKSFETPITHKFFYMGDTFEDVLKQIQTLPHHLKNLRHHLKCAFKDARGVKHQWQLEHMKEMN